MFPVVKYFFLPRVKFYQQGEDCPLMSNEDIAVELKKWFGNTSDSKNAIEAGISLVGRYAPKCTNKKLFTAMAKFVAFGYIFDDVDPGNQDDKHAEQYANRKSIFRNVALVVSEDKMPETKIERAAAEIYKDLRACTSPGPYSRHVMGFRTWAESMCSERQGEVPKTFDEFMQFRKDNGGYFGMTAITECLMDIDVHGFWDTVKPLYDEVYTHMMLTNDLYSFRKEYFSKDTTNVLHFLTAIERMPFQAAIDKVCEMISSRSTNIKSLAKRILRNNPNNPLMEKYIKSLQDMVSGNLLHSQSITRYHGNRTLPVKSGFVLMHSQKTIVISSLPSICRPILGWFLRTIE